VPGKFMDALFKERFAALVGPLEGTRDALLILRASSPSEVAERLAANPWTTSGLLVTRFRGFFIISRSVRASSR